MTRVDQISRTTAVLLSAVMVLSSVVVRQAINDAPAAAPVSKVALAQERPVVDGHPLFDHSAIRRPGARCFEVWWDESPNVPNEPSGWRRFFYDPEWFGGRTTVGADWRGSQAGSEPVRPCGGLALDAVADSLP